MARDQAPARYSGGLLFGQLVPRFDNRIIARCPLAFERIYQEAVAGEGDENAAHDRAGRLAQVSAASCRECFRYRWGIARAGERDPRPLKPEERRSLDEQRRTLSLPVVPPLSRCLI